MRKKIEILQNDKTFDRDYDEFINNCKARNLRPATINFHDNSIKSIYKFIHPKTTINTIDSDTVSNFILYCKKEMDIKDIAINTYLRALKTILYYFIKLGYMNKFHISEIKYNKEIIETIDIENELIYFKTTKNRKPLILPINQSLKVILKEYLITYVHISNFL